MKDNRQGVLDILGGLPIAAFVIDKDHKILHWNRALESLTGLKAEVMIGTKQHWKAFYKSERPLLADLLVDGKVEEIQNRYTGKYAKSDLLDDAYEATDYFSDLGIVGVIEILDDITKPKLAEDKLRKSEERYRSVVEDSPLMVCNFLPDGTITFVNSAYCKFFGKSCKKLIGKNIIFTIPEEDRESVMSNIASLTEESPILSFVNKVIKHGGEIRWQRWTNRALFDNEEQIIGIQSFGEDVTELVEAEQAIRREKHRAQKYLEIAEVIMLVLNHKGEITLVNQKGYKLLGYQKGELIGKNWFDTCVPERNRKEGRKVFKKILSGGPELVEYYESPILTKSGKERTIAWRNTVLWDEKGHNVGSLSSGEDITKRVRAGKLLNALNRVAVSIGEAQTQQEVFNAVAEELKQLDISCTLFPVDEKQDKLITKYVSYDSAALTAAEKLLGIEHQNFSFPIDVVDVCLEVVIEKKTVFIDDSKQTLQQMLPKISKKLSAQIVKTLRACNIISAPLIVKDQVIGVFSIQSNILTREDVSAATAFTDQLSSAWNKIELLQNLRKTVEGTIHTIAATVEARDPYTAGHQRRVADLAAAIAGEMKLSDEQVEGIKMAGIIHDLGKIQVPAEILSKPGKLNDLEFQIIQTHPQVGFNLLKGIEFPWPIAEMVLQHHEKMDGSGYPQGLKGDDILLEARILAVSDVVEAMSSHRPYRPALGIEKALKEISRNRGILYDPDVVDACIKVFEEGYKLLQS
jgi:PAS domain S-box-containing protein